MDLLLLSDVILLVAVARTESFRHSLSEDSLSNVRVFVKVNPSSDNTLVNDTDLPVFSSVSYTHLTLPTKA